MDNEKVENVFSGWETQEGGSFFGDAVVETSPEEEKEEGIAEEEKVDVEDKEVEEVEEKEDIFENITAEPEDTTQVEEVEEVEAGEQDSAAITTLNYLRESGVADLGSEGEDLSSEDAEELIQDSINKSVDTTIGEMFSDLPQVVKDINKYVLDGGNVEEFLSSIVKSNSVGITENIDLTEEVNQKKVIINQLKSEGYDQDYIDSQIDFLKDSDKLESTSKTHFKRWKQKTATEREDLLAKQEEQKQIKKKQALEFKRKVKDFVRKSNKVKGFTLSKQDKLELPKYTTERTVKLSNGSVVTEMQSDLYKALEDEENFMLMAKLLKSDFDFSNIETNIKTEVSKEIKASVRRASKNKPSRSATQGSQKQKNELADFF